MANISQQVFAYIEGNIDSSLTLEQVSAHIGLSAFHLHRCIKRETGITLKALVRHIKMYKACFLLAYRQHLSVTDVAMIVGYNGSDSFSRAFRQYYAMSPSYFRDNPSSYTIQPLHTFLLPHLLSRFEQGIEVTVRSVNERHLFCMMHKGSPENVVNTVRAFIHWRKAHGFGKSKYRTFNLHYSAPNTPPEAFTMAVGVEVPKTLLNPTPETVREVNLKPSKYACMQVEGSDYHFTRVFSYFFEHWLPASSYTVTDGPVVIERKAFYPDVALDKAVSEIMIPIQ
ncbi:helix-turn-helix domain-containing protein [Aestuariibacter sp. AA17]|uniref:Helix-turn-helix domain-containing protein n=1 Tax=Fluctibacter corallii TaxID=2984329 RepID=A0ABT3ACA8_9ALTE|nr:GyrI-like domain-containing protein [Aestuariibacter sp. AA17]MCV2885916.1 helix-turn-helix domain-containing protein [Aestuariibacter sp. AA17]